MNFLRADENGDAEVAEVRRRTQKKFKNES